MYEKIMQNAPPSAYEKVVFPVIMSQPISKLGEEKPYRDTKKDKKRKPKKTEPEEKDFPFEPYVGKLFDYSA